MLPRVRVRKASQDDAAAVAQLLFESAPDMYMRFSGGRERVIAGTDCGFAQGTFYRRVHPSIMWAKLEALVAGAHIASRQLWH